MGPACHPQPRVRSRCSLADNPSSILLILSSNVAHVLATRLAGVKSIHFPLPSLDDRAINPTTSVDRGHSNEKNGRATLAIIPSIQSMAPAYKRRPPHPLLSIIRTPSHPSTLSLPPASPPLFRSIGGRVLASCSRRPHNTYLILSIHLSSNSM